MILRYICSQVSALHVIFGRADHHCGNPFEDNDPVDNPGECYYMPQDIYDTHNCNPVLSPTGDNLLPSSRQWWTLLVVSHVLESLMGFVFACCGNAKSDDSNKSDDDHATGLVCVGFVSSCCLCCICPFSFLVIIAAIANSSFASHLFLPHVTGELTVWLFHLILIPILVLLIYLQRIAFEDKCAKLFEVILKMYFLITDPF